MHTPDSPYSTAPCTRNSSASKVLPQPALPHTSVVRPFGRPPPVTSSSPSIPVGAFGSGVRDSFNLARGIARRLKLSPFRFCCHHILTKRRRPDDRCPAAGGKKKTG